MRSVRLTGGFSGDVEVLLKDTKKQNLALSSFKIGLVPLDEEPPSASSPIWEVPSSKEFPRAGQALLTLRPAVSHPLGKFWPHVLVIDSGRDPELVPADDYVELT